MKEKDKKQYIHIEQSRLPEQRAVMEKILKDRVCPFCPENLSQYHKEPILQKGKYWILTKNQWPYENTKYHFLAIHINHIEHVSEISDDASVELFNFFKWAAREYKMPGGAIALRFGNNPPHGNYGSSVHHLHAHLIEANLENPNKEQLKFKIGQPSKE